jgi:putative FmdB family regulatory protein
MPIYEYQCDNCGVFEVSQRITEDPLKKCPTCKGKVRRLISNTSFLLKGNGWYATDYGRSKSSSSESSSANGKSESSSSTSSAEKSSSSDKSSSSTSSGSDKPASS